jgi:hypothetical protein
MRTFPRVVHCLPYELNIGYLFHVGKDYFISIPENFKSIRERFPEWAFIKRKIFCMRLTFDCPTLKRGAIDEEKNLGFSALRHSRNFQGASRFCNRPHVILVRIFFESRTSLRLEKDFYKMTDAALDTQSSI